MSLRRSARVATNTAAEAKAEKVVTKTEKLTKTASAPKKRKSQTSANSLAQASKEEAEGSIIPTPDLPFAIPGLPSAPLPKRRKAPSVSPVKLPPFTPTPSGVGLIVSGARKAKTAKKNEVDLKSRPAEPHVTNAPLLTPGGTQVVAYQSSPDKPSSSQDVPSASQDSPAKKRKAKAAVPPDVGALPAASTDIDLLLKDAEAYLVKVDPTLKELVENHQCKMFTPEGLSEVVDPFTALSSGIIGQQVSGQAAASIRKKFTALFPDTHPEFPSPAQVVEKDLPTLRTAGLSQRKAEYISGLAEKFVSGELSAEMLISASDEELIEKLVAVRGLGRWSVEMFACFGLKRMDVFATGDLGVQRGMAAYKGRDTSKLKAKGGKWKYMSEQEMLEIASKFSPYRSLFMWYMWWFSDTETAVLE